MQKSGYREYVTVACSATKGTPVSHAIPLRLWTHTGRERGKTVKSRGQGGTEKAVFHLPGLPLPSSGSSIHSLVLNLSTNYPLSLSGSSSPSTYLCWIPVLTTPSVWAGLPPLHLLALKPSTNYPRMWQEHCTNKLTAIVFACTRPTQTNLVTPQHRGRKLTSPYPELRSCWQLIVFEGGRVGFL